MSFCDCAACVRVSLASAWTGLRVILREHRRKTARPALSGQSVLAFFAAFTIVNRAAGLSGAVACPSTSR